MYTRRIPSSHTPGACEHYFKEAVGTWANAYIVYMVVIAVLVIEDVVVIGVAVIILVFLIVVGVIVYVVIVVVGVVVFLAVVVVVVVCVRFQGY